MTSVTADTHRLRFGPYHTPLFEYGQSVDCRRFGEITIAGLTDAPIPWPIGKHGRSKSLVLTGDLCRAVEQKSNMAVAKHWGVTGQTVTLWRHVLGIQRANAGTSAVLHDLFRGQEASMRVLALPTLSSPERRQKIAAAKRGKPRPPHVVEAITQAHTGLKHSAESRRKMSESHKRNGHRPPKAGRAWTAEEEQLLRTLPPAEVAERTGRTLIAVWSRRRKLGLPDGRRH
ncbi:hypothetical protein GC163_21175 [bacterium]|nr:hypothetical protein [bacterium]